MNLSEQLQLIRRGTVEVISQADLTEKLKTQRSLVVKAGFDPTAADLHLGHTVLLRKLRHFQDLGHKVVFLIGDATSLVGDPSGQSKTRKLMTWDQVRINAQTYERQVKKILTVNTPQLYERRYNSEWFGHRDSEQPFGLEELVELASRYTVARLIERDDFQKRLKAGQEISVLELFYPLMQGYDSVKLNADVEVGGTDQKFNLLVGRDLQRAYGQSPQVVITMPLLEGTDGVQKMSKSLGNHVGINDPPSEVFGKIMSIPDGLIIKYFTLLTDVEPSWLGELEQQLAARKVNPRDAKLDLAEVLVGMYHGSEAAKQSRQEFLRVFSQRQTPSSMDVHFLTARNTAELSDTGEPLVDVISLLIEANLAKTKNDARRLLRQGAVKLNGVAVTQPRISFKEAVGAVLQVGSRRFLKLALDKSSREQ